MCKLISFVCLVLTFALVATTYVDCPDPRNQLVIGDLEEQMDGWQPWGSATVNYSGVGVTLNEWSLETRTSTGWQQDIGYAFTGDRAAFFNHQYFCIDITRLADEWTRNAILTRVTGAA